MGCPYPDELLEKWDGVMNELGSECRRCPHVECEHNPSQDGYDLEDEIEDMP